MLAKIITVLPALLLVAATSKTPCKPVIPGALYPWQSSEIMKGDQWGNFLIDIDAKGRALRCRIGENNIHEDELGFWSCNALMRDKRYDPFVEDGKAVPGTIKTFMLVSIGRRHAEKDDAARKAFFRAHPDERTACYPD